MDISLEDLKTAISALESWLDAFGDDEDEDAIRVRRVIAGFELIIKKQSLKGGK